MHRLKPWILLALAAALGVGLGAGRAAMHGRAAPSSAPPNNDAGSETAHNRGIHPVFVSVPDGPPRIPTGDLDEFGRAVTVSCASCHANIDTNPTRASADDPPMRFHQGLTFNHGALSCTSCHNPHDYNTLRLADGAPVPYPRVMTMCGQCHAPQHRDWLHGAHGGMTGYWDLTRGPRHRKSCIDCHDPHAPAFPAMSPTFKPVDRFLAPHGAAKGGSHE